MDLHTKLELVKAPPVQEVLVEDELRGLFETNSKPRHYIGLEVSGLLHVGSLIANGLVINNLIKAGVECQVYLADWHSVINRKLEGDWEKIKKASKYYEEAFKFYCPEVKIVRGSELYSQNDEFWKKTIEFSQHVTLARGSRCLTIMGRSDRETVHLAQFFYPPMQAVDIHELKADIAHSGMDQRKIHVLAREIFPKMGWKPPVCIHHHLLPSFLEPPYSEKTVALGKGESLKVFDRYAITFNGTISYKAGGENVKCPEFTVFDEEEKQQKIFDTGLGQGHTELGLNVLPTSMADDKVEVRLKTKEIDVIGSKMSKSKPESAVFIHDSEKLIREKLNKAYCPPRTAEPNPVLEFTKYVIFPALGELNIERPTKFGGNVSFGSYGETEKAFISGQLHPADLKTGVASSLNGIVGQVRKHFEKNKKLLEVYDEVKITR
ncbi:tyrosine--tRNA ligase [Candidatus Micrarchaeota archaeon]|nr:tyrosine--tRNA ligase [Candidatus Micrarchaeota archaeon]